MYPKAEACRSSLVPVPAGQHACLTVLADHTVVGIVLHDLMGLKPLAAFEMMAIGE